MILHNQTKAPDIILRNVLQQAGRHATADIEGVHVRVTRGRSAAISGATYPSDIAEIGGAEYPTNCGWFSITLPVWSPDRRITKLDPMELAARFYWIAWHEWYHVLELQCIAAGAALEWADVVNERRCPHRMRPEELRAEAAEICARVNPLTLKQHAAILALSIWMEAAANA